MPSLITAFGYKIYFWSNEGMPLEPIHVHISKTPHANATKVWINEDGTCSIANNNDEIPTKDLKRLLATIQTFSEEIITKWTEVFHEQPKFQNTLNEYER